MVRTMVVSASLAVIPITNDLSIFNSSIGSCRRFVSEEKPMRFVEAERQGFFKRLFGGR